MLKKTIRRLGALAMVLAMAVSVFAVNASAIDVDAVELPKTYEKKGTATVEPTEALSFDLLRWSAADYNNSDYDTNDNIPHANLKIEKAATDGAKFVITKPTGFKETDIGTFTYVLKEHNAGTAGVDYDATEINLVIQRTWNEAGTAIEEHMYLNKTVTNSEGKTQQVKVENIKNTFTAGELKISKTVTGKLGDKSKKFKFYVMFVAPTGETVNNDITYKYSTTGATDSTIAKGWTGTHDTVEIELANGEDCVFKNIPSGVTYTVTEESYNDYTTKYNNSDTATKAEGTIDDAQVAVNVTNNKDATTPGGVIMTIAPYALMLVVAGAFAVVFLSRRNRAE